MKPKTKKKTLKQLRAIGNFIFNGGLSPNLNKKLKQK